MDDVRLNLRPILHTERLTLTLFDPQSQTDYELLFPLIVYLKHSLNRYIDSCAQLTEARRQAEESMKFYQTRGRIDAGLLHGRTPTTAAIWLIRLGSQNPAGQCIGVSTVLHRHPLPDQGWVIDPQYDGKGYASEASDRILHYFSEELGIRKLMVTTLPANVASKKVATKLGYVPHEDGLLLDDGVTYDVHLLPRDFKSALRTIDAGTFNHEN